MSVSSTSALSGADGCAAGAAGTLELGKVFSSKAGLAPIRCQSMVLDASGAVQSPRFVSGASGGLASLGTLKLDCT